MAPAAKLSCDPSDVDLRPAASCNDLHSVFHHHRHDDGIRIEGTAQGVRHPVQIRASSNKKRAGLKISGRG